MANKQSNVQDIAGNVQSEDLSKVNGTPQASRFGAYLLHPVIAKIRGASDSTSAALRKAACEIVGKDDAQRVNDAFDTLDEIVSRAQERLLQSPDVQVNIGNVYNVSTGSFIRNVLNKPKTGEVNRAVNTVLGIE